MGRRALGRHPVSAWEDRSAEIAILAKHFTSRDDGYGATWSCECGWEWDGDDAREKWAGHLVDELAAGRAERRDESMRKMLERFEVRRDPNGIVEQLRRRQQEMIHRPLGPVTWEFRRTDDPA